MRGGLALQMTPYLHMLRMPLAKAGALDQAVWELEGRRTGSRRMRGTLWGVMCVREDEAVPAIWSRLLSRPPIGC